MHVLRGPGPFPIAVALTGGKYQKKTDRYTFQTREFSAGQKMPRRQSRAHALTTDTRTDGRTGRKQYRRRPSCGPQEAYK